MSFWVRKRGERCILLTQDIIAYFVAQGGWSTNNQLVNHFGDTLLRSHLAPHNKASRKEQQGRKKCRVVFNPLSI
jgi:hypothetical protein